MQIVKLPPASRPGRYQAKWYRQVGDTIKKGELLANIYEKPGVWDRFFKSKGGQEPKYYCDVTSPVDGILQQILGPDASWIEPETDIGLALISTIPEPLEAIKIFYSYASEDEPLRKELEKQLSVLRRQGFVVEWHKGDISAGSEWQKQANLYLNTAHIILVLTSSDFMASDNCYSSEMQTAMQRHHLKEARIVPVLLRPCEWKGSPLAELQALPTNAVPITLWDNRDEAFLNVAQGIRKVVQETVEGYLKHVQLTLAQETEQYNSLKRQAFSLRKAVDGNNIRLQELSREIGTTRQQLSLYKDTYNKLETEKASLETIRANLQKQQLEISERDLSLSSIISNLREGVNTSRSKFTNEIETLQQHVKSYQEIDNKLTSEKANLESTHAKLQNQLDKVNLAGSISLKEIEILQTQEQKAIEMLSKVKF